MTGIFEATSIVLTDEERAELEALARSTKTEFRTPWVRRVRLLRLRRVKASRLGDLLQQSDEHH